VSDELRFPVSTFLRVFDTEPAAEAPDLAELVRALRRFEIRADTVQAVEREVARIERARDEVLAGRGDGPAARLLAKAGSEAEVRERAARMVDEARKEAKKDLRLWSPARYPPGASRGSESVVSLSCLVLDYDAGVPVEEAGWTWERWFHVLHSTWSHGPGRPRFRVVLPLALPVAAADWPLVWAWADEQAGHTVDPALKGPAATFALPASPSRDSPRIAEVNGGELLDPAAEGLAVGPAPPFDPVPGVPTRMLRLDVRREVVDG
jgi:hypothetical protein